MLELKKARTDLAAVIEHALETSRPFLDQRRQTIAVERPEPVYATVDSTRVSQILGNLVHNASKFTPTGGQIRIELAASGRTAAVRVIDSGSGIPTGQIDRVFDMFTQIERSSRPAGSGLGIGLALARRLAQMHGGDLTAASPGEGQGATFTLTLPAEPAVPAEAASPPAAGPRAAAPLAPLDIVVVEDNEDAADTLALWLEELGHRVRVARTGPDGVGLVRAARPDVVLCDIGLPEMDGVEVCRRIKSLEGGPPPVMVALTGWGMEDDRRRTGEAGFAHHLVKPVVPDQLRAILKSVTDALRPGGTLSA
jgi:CheY-like chemotaxis protein